MGAVSDFLFGDGESKSTNSIPSEIASDVGFARELKKTMLREDPEFAQDQKAYNAAASSKNPADQALAKQIYAKLVNKVQKYAADKGYRAEGERRQQFEGEVANLKDRQNSDEDAIRAQSESASKLTDGEIAIQDLFKKATIDFLSMDKSGKISPEMQKQAQEFVDATYTTAANEQYRQYSRDYQNNQDAQAAALGRQPLDSALAERTARQLGEAGAQIGIQRGSLIAQEAKGLENQAYTRGLDGLQAGQAGLNGVGQIQQQRLVQPTFLNQLNQQAMQNRVNLLNLQSQPWRDAVQGRLGSVTQTNQQADAGLLGNLAGVVGAGAKAYGAATGADASKAKV